MPQPPNYLLSFKARDDWDGSTAPADDYVDRLQIHTDTSFDARTRNTLLVKALGAGDVFTGRASRGGSPVPLTIRVADIGSDAITVLINAGCGNHRGAMVCGQTASGSTYLGTDSVGLAVGGKAGFDHVWDFTLDQPATVQFDGCGSAFDTVITIFDRLEPGADGVVRTAATTRHAQADEGCTGVSGPSLLSATLSAGDFSVVMEGYGSSEQGEYTMTMECTYTNFQGAMVCGETVSGDTVLPGTDSVGEAAGGRSGADHFWHFALDQETAVTFDGCNTGFDTVIGIFDRGLTGALDRNDDGCGGFGGASRLSVTLPAGEYSVVVEGYSMFDQGPYSMTMACQAAATLPPTPRPTPPPDGGRCPEGYGDYGTRYAWGLGQITIVTAHQDCADRCTQFSNPSFAGGCKGYMTGMYYGMLYCRSYGGNRFETPCAPWATAEHAGIGSGALGDTHARTGQHNVGGSCCTNNLWLFGSGPTPPPTGPLG